MNWSLILASGLLGGIGTLYLGAIIMISPQAVGKWLLSFMPENATLKIKAWWQKESSPLRVLFLRLFGLLIFLMTASSLTLELTLFIEAIKDLYTK
jgi:hypothetical protein